MRHMYLKHLKHLKHFKLMLLLSFFSTTGYAHDPIFGLGPHTLFKNGVEQATEIKSLKTGDQKQQSLAFDFRYGITSDWSVGISLPYVNKQQAALSSSGKGDITYLTKYRFWRKDSLGLQQSAAFLFKFISDTADQNRRPALDKGNSDTIVGFTYGYEGRKWYHWTSGRYRNNSKTKTGFHRGHRFRLDFVVGYRPVLSQYREPDTVWLLELNGEFDDPAELLAVKQENTGGKKWFISPGIFWTKRNFAIKAGVQIPVLQDVNGVQEKADYRAKLTFEWHL